MASLLDLMVASVRGLGAQVRTYAQTAPVQRSAVSDKVGGDTSDGVKSKMQPDLIGLGMVGNHKVATPQQVLDAVENVYAMASDGGTIHANRTKHIRGQVGENFFLTDNRALAGLVPGASMDFLNVVNSDAEVEAAKLIGEPHRRAFGRNKTLARGSFDPATRGPVPHGDIDSYDEAVPWVFDARPASTYLVAENKAVAGYGGCVITEGVERDVFDGREVNVVHSFHPTDSAGFIIGFWLLPSEKAPIKSIIYRSDSDYCLRITDDDKFRWWWKLPATNGAWVEFLLKPELLTYSGYQPDADGRPKPASAVYTELDQVLVYLFNDTDANKTFSYYCMNDVPPLYTASCPVDSKSLVATVSKGAYSDYWLDARVYTKSAQNDPVGLVIGYATDPDGTTHTLTIIRNFYNVPSADAPFALCVQVDAYTTDAVTIQGTNDGQTTWPTATSKPGKDTPLGQRIRVGRSGDYIQIESTDWGGTEFVPESKMILQLGNHPALVRFRTPSPYGFVCISQDQAFWEVHKCPPDRLPIVDTRLSKLQEWDGMNWRINPVGASAVVLPNRFYYNESTKKLFYAETDDLLLNIL